MVWSLSTWGFFSFVGREKGEGRKGGESGGDDDEGFAIACGYREDKMATELNIWNSDTHMEIRLCFQKICGIKNGTIHH